MTRAGGSRAEKYRRLLPRLVLDRPVFVPHQPIAVTVAEPFDALCDVTFRLVHASGRTYAEHTAQLGPDGPAEIALGSALNLPAGGFDVLATPPLGEFFTTTPVAHRLPLTVAASDLVAAPDAGVESRRTMVLAGLDCATPTERRDRLRALVAAQAAAGHGLSGLALAAINGGDGAALARALHQLGTSGSAMTPGGLAAAVVALAALTVRGRDDVDELAAALIDKFGLCLALTAAAGLPASFPPGASARLDPSAALAWYLWGTGVADATAPSVCALALAEAYEPPPLLAAIAAPAGADLARQSEAGRPVLTVWRDGPALVASCGDAWQARLGADAVVAAEGHAVVMQDAAGIVARTAAASRVAVPFWAFDTVERTAATILGRLGDHCVALATDGAFLTPRAHAAAAVVLDGAASVACRVGRADAAEALLADAVAALAPAAGPAAAEPALHIDSRFCRMRFGDDRIAVTCGDAVLHLDFTPLLLPAKGTVR